MQERRHTTNDHEFYARQRKAMKLLDLITEEADKAGVDLTDEALALMKWNHAALLAKVKPPSEKTIALVCEMVRKRRRPKVSRV